MSFGLTQKTAKQLKDLFKKYPEISQVKIYGSRARGDYKRGSDIDLAFFSESTKELSLRLSWELKELATPYLFDVVNYKILSNNYLKKEIDKYGKVFYIKNKTSTKFVNAAKPILATPDFRLKKNRVHHSRKPRHSRKLCHSRESGNPEKPAPLSARVKNPKQPFTSTKANVPQKNKFNNIWPLVKLEDVAKIVSGQSPEGKYYNKNRKGLPFYQGKTEFTNIYIGKPRAWTKKTTKIAEKDDILISVRAPVGPVNIATQKICIGRGLAAIRPQKIDQIFLFQYLISSENQIKGSGGTIFDSINREQLKIIKIPLPPLKEQKKIAGVLSQIQEAIETQNKLIKKTKELKKSTMKHLFTYGTKNQKTNPSSNSALSANSVIPSDSVPPVNHVIPADSVNSHRLRHSRESGNPEKPAPEQARIRNSIQFLTSKKTK